MFGRAKKFSVDDLAKEVVRELSNQRGLFVYPVQKKSPFTLLDLGGYLLIRVGVVAGELELQVFIHPENWEGTKPEARESRLADGQRRVEKALADATRRLFAVNVTTHGFYSGDDPPGVQWRRYRP